MADPFFGEIRVMANTFAPYDWAFCNGQEIPIVQNSALYAVIGIAFGGNGTTTFKLPDFRSAVPMGSGNGLGLTPRILGQYTGAADVTLINSNMPIHTHPLSGRTGLGDQGTPAANLYPAVDQGNTTSENIFYMVPGTTSPNTMMAPNSIGGSGGGLSHPNTQPYLTMNFCICTSGEFPVRN